MSGGKENGCAESVVGKITPFTKLKSALAFYIMSEGALMRVLRHDAAGDGVHTVAICAALAMVAGGRWWLAGDDVHTVAICAARAMVAGGRW